MFYRRSPPPHIHLLCFIVDDWLSIILVACFIRGFVIKIYRDIYFVLNLVITQFDVIKKRLKHGDLAWILYRNVVLLEILAMYFYIGGIKMCLITIKV